MPWTPKDATRHTKKATSGIAKRQWSDVADSVLRSSGDEGRAVREANAAVAKRQTKNFRGESHGYDSARPKRPVRSEYK
jgi:hypothetical protein